MQFGARRPGEAAVTADLVVFPSWPDDFPTPEAGLLDLIRGALYRPRGCPHLSWHRLRPRRLPASGAYATGFGCSYCARPATGHRAASGRRFGETLTWALAHLGGPLSVDDLAAHANMSRRNFTRRFRETTGTTPAKWILARRLDDARLLLETTTWPISHIAEACGFGNTVTFRQNFLGAYATTPTSYRRRFAVAT